MAIRMILTDGPTKVEIHNGSMRICYHSLRKWKLTEANSRSVKKEIFKPKGRLHQQEIVSDDYHGTSGPLNVDPNRFAPLYEEWMEVGKEMGYKVQDPNAAAQDECICLI